MNIFHMMSDHGGHAASGMITKAGISSIALGAGSSASKLAIETQDPAWLTITDVAGIVSIIGGVVFIIKLFVDMYYANKKDKREEAQANAKN